MDDWIHAEVATPPAEVQQDANLLSLLCNLLAARSVAMWCNAAVCFIALQHKRMSIRPSEIMFYWLHIGCINVHKKFSTYKKLEKETIYMVKINKLRKFVDAWNTSVNPQHS